MVPHVPLAVLCLTLLLAGCGGGDSFTQTSPAVPDAYYAVGNTTLTVDAVNGVLANDGGGAVTGADATSAQGGTVAVAADGSFTYEPPVGYTGMDTFSYVKSNSGATVTISVAELVWYIDDTAAAGGNGTLATPFASLAEFGAANGMGGSGDPAAGARIYVFTGSGTPYDGGITLLDGQTLHGAGVEFMVGGQVLQPAGTRPVLTNSGGAGITLASGCSVRGLDVANTTGVGIGANAAAGPLLINDVAVRDTGDVGIDLADCTGTITLGDAAAPSLLLDVAGQHGVRVVGSFPTLALLGVEVLNAADALVLTNVNAQVEGCFLGTDATSATGAITRGAVVFHGGGTAMNATLTNVVVRGATSVGIEVDTVAAATLTLGLTGCDVVAVGGGLLVEDSGVLDQIRMSVSGCTFRASGGALAVHVIGGIVDSTTVTGWGDATIVGDDGGGGVRFTIVTFDADPDLMGIQQVPAGTLQVGAVTARVEGDGLRFDDPTGDLGFTSVTVFNNGGTGLYVDTKGLGTTFNLDVAGGSISTTNGPVLFLDPPADCPPLQVDITLDAVCGPRHHPRGIVIDNVGGALSIREPVRTGVVVRRADDLMLDLRRTAADARGR